MDKEVLQLLLKLLGDLQKSVDKIDNRLCALEAKPVRRMDTFINAVLATIGGAIGGAFLGKYIK